MGEGARGMRYLTLWGMVGGWEGGGGGGGGGRDILYSDSEDEGVN